MKSWPFSINSILNQHHALKYKLLLGIVFLSLGAFVQGCTAPEPPAKITVTQAQKAFEQKCLKDYNMHIRTRQVGSTFWAYLPIKDPIFDYETQKPKAGGDQPTPPKYLVAFVDGKFKNNLFSFEYDIVDKKKTKDEDYGFSSSYTDSYVKYQNNLFTAIYEVFLNIKPKDGEIAPKFFVLIITDIKKGIETRATFFLDDFVRYMSGALPYDEYIKRFISDRKGSTSLIDDQTGSHIHYYDIAMSEFLTKQIINRINFKFQYSDFSPDEKYDNAIIGLVADTLRYYSFSDFTNVRLNNIRLDKKYFFDKKQLENFGDDKPSMKPEGKLIHIRFKDGKPEFDEEPSAQPSSTSPSPSNQSP